MPRRAGSARDSTIESDPSNSAGSRFDATDLVIGLVLAAVIPVGFAFVLSVCGIPLSRSAIVEVADRQARIERVPATPAELQALHAVATKILDESATFYVNKWRTEGDNIARIFESRWARHCLEHTKSKFEQFIREVNSSPGSYPQLVQLVAVAEGRLGEIQGYFDELEKGAQPGE